MGPQATSGSVRPPEAAAVSPGVWRLPIGLAGHSVGHVNVYALEARDGLLLVDTGWSGTKDQLEALLRGIGATVHDVRMVVLTHVHADHCGLAGMLQRAGATVAMHEREADDFRRRYVAVDAFTELTARWSRTVGLTSRDHAVAMRQAAAGPTNVTRFEPDRRLRDGDRIVLDPWDLEVLHTPGHTRGHCCYRHEATGLLFTGDNMFPRMRANATARPHSTDDPVGDYLAGLERLERLDVRLALPGHQHPFGEFGERVAQLRDYHRERLIDVLKLIARQPNTAFDVSALLTRQGSFSQISRAGRLAAVGETHAHLCHLEHEGLALSTGENPVLWSAA